MIRQPHGTRFGKLRACWAILRGGSVIQNFDIHGTAYTTSKHGRTQLNHVLIKGQPMRLTDLTTYPKQVSV